jgi:hypothetical protein
VTVPEPPNISPAPGGPQESKITSTFWNDWKYKDCTAISPLKTQFSKLSKPQANGPPCMLKSRGRYQLLYVNVEGVSRGFLVIF